MCGKIHEYERFEGNEREADWADASEFEECEFVNCDLSIIDLSSKSFLDCCFSNCNLAGALLADAELRNCSFSGSKLTGVDFSACSSFLFSASFTDCILDYAIFYQRKMPKTVFSNCRMTGADFSEADLTKALFENCDLSGAMFSRTNLVSANLSSAYNFSIDPENNSIKKAVFSSQSLMGLLDKYGIVVE